MSAAGALVGLANRGITPVVRNERTLAGAYIANLMSTNTAIALCQLCIMKFDHKRHRYLPATRWGRTVGNCDGCREHCNTNILFIHESTVSDSGGRIRSGQVYTPQ